MKCNDLLRKMPEKLREQMESSIHFSAKIKQGHELIELITNPSMLEATFRNLSEIEKAALRLIVSKFGTEPFDASKLENIVRTSHSGAGLKAALILLRQKGILFSLRKTWGESLFLLPFDTFPIWQRLVLSELHAEESTAVTEHLEITHGSRGSLLHALFRLVVYAAKNDVGITQKGTIHKRHLQKLEEQLELSPESFRSFPLRYAGQPVYSKGFAMVLDMAIRLKLLQADADRLMINIDEIRSFLVQPNDAMHAELLDLWSQVHWPESGWLRQAAAAIRNVAPNAWFPVERIMVWLNDNHLLEPSLGTNETQTAFVEQWLEPMAELGWIEIGISREKTLFRWLVGTSMNCKKVPTENLRPSDGLSFVFFVQPDMEVIVPPDVPFDVRWELECFAEYLNTDQISRYRITKESIHRACANGRTSAEVIQFMKRHAKFGVPDNVEKTITDWGEQYGQFVFEQLVILRCQDVRTAELVARDAKYASFVKERIGDHYFVLEKEHIEPFMKALQLSGYAPQRDNSVDGGHGLRKFPKWNQSESESQLPQIADSSNDYSYSDVNNDGDNRSTFLSRGIVYPNDSFHYFELDPKLPDIEDIYPNLHEIPAMWLRDCRAYHSSTKKEMIEKAMEWRACLKISREGSETTFIPRSLRQTTDGWQVIGIGTDQEMVLSPEEWQQMQLILPGINDSL